MQETHLDDLLLRFAADCQRQELAELAEKLRHDLEKEAPIQQVFSWPDDAATLERQVTGHRLYYTTVRAWRLFPAGLLFESAVPAVFYACGTPHNSYSAGPSLAGCTVYTFRAGREADPASARFGADHGKAYICGETSLANGTLLVWHKRGDADTPAGVSG